MLELVQGECNLKWLELELKKLINLKDKTQQEGYKKIPSILGQGGASDKTANLIYNAIIK